MLPPDKDWDDDPRPTDLDGENLFYAKDLKCHSSAPSARSRFNSLRQAWTSGATQLTKRAARTSADALGWIADQFTHLACYFLRRPKWTAINRHSCSVFMKLGSWLDRAAIWLLLRSR